MRSAKDGGNHNVADDISATTSAVANGHNSAIGKYVAESGIQSLPNGDVVVHAVESSATSAVTNGIHSAQETNINPTAIASPAVTNSMTSAKICGSDYAAPNTPSVTNGMQPANHTAECSLFRQSDFRPAPGTLSPGKPHLFYSVVAVIRLLLLKGR